MRVWDVASGRAVRQFVGSMFAFLEVPSAHTRQDRKLLVTVRSDHAGFGGDDTLLIYEVAKELQHTEDGAATAPVACFKVPGSVTSLRCHTTTICVGCTDGQVCILSSPFLTA